MKNIIHIFSENMYKYRKEKNLTQEKLADLLQLDNSYISLLERGSRIPSLQTLDHIANFFGIKADDLITENPEKNRLSLKQKELIYMLEDADSHKIDKIHRIINIANEIPDD